MQKKYYHIVLKKNGHFYYEIFEESLGAGVDIRIIRPIISSFEYSKEEIDKRIFSFKTIFDLKHNHTFNMMLKNEYDEERLFFLSSVEAIDTIKKLYTDLAQNEISQTLKKYDTIN